MVLANLSLKEMKKYLLLLMSMFVAMVSIVIACNGELEERPESLPDMVSSEVKGCVKISSQNRDGKVTIYTKANDKIRLSLTEDSSAIFNFDFDDVSVTIQHDTSFISGLSDSYDKLNGYWADSNLYLSITRDNLNDTLYFVSKSIPVDLD